MKRIHQIVITGIRLDYLKRLAEDGKGDLVAGILLGMLENNFKFIADKALDSLLQKEREAGKREGIEDLKKLIEKSRGNDYHNIGIGELDYHEKCAVDAYIETLKSRMSKLKSQSVEKSNSLQE